MRVSHMEDWALAATFVFAVAFAVTINEARHFKANAETVDATPAPQFVMTVTAKRIPTACKGAAMTSATCSKYLDGDAVVELQEAAPSYATR